MFSAALLLGTGVSGTHSDNDDMATTTFTTDPGLRMEYMVSVPYNSGVDRAITNSYLDDKADSLCNAYISNMLRAQAKLEPLLGKRGYSAAVRAELPGAPVGQHCVWGQHTQLSRALKQRGDTLTVIPQGGRTSCILFKHFMREKYSTPEYDGAIKDGVMHKSDSAYTVSLNKYLARNKVSVDTPDSVRQSFVNKFAAHNFSADSLDSGSILIVPRHHGSRNTFHAIMYLGRGRVENGAFIPDSNGVHIYTGHNRETMGDLFKTYDTSNVFAANTKKIVRTGYAQELARVQSMSKDELIAFLSSDSDSTQTANELQMYHQSQLARMARDKYFKKDLHIMHPTSLARINDRLPMISNPVLMQLDALKQHKM